MFSTIREDSQISRLARGELTVEGYPEVAEVLDLCAEAERVSDGWFSSNYRAWLDPTGIVKGWVDLSAWPATSRRPARPESA